MLEFLSSGQLHWSQPEREDNDNCQRDRFVGPRWPLAANGRSRLLRLTGMGTVLYFTNVCSLVGKFLRHHCEVRIETMNLN